MKKIISMVLVLVMICSFSAVAFAEGKQTLVFGTSADYAPFEFMYPDETGKMVYGGIDVMVAQYIADYLDMELQIENMDFGYLLTALNKGDFDMVLADIEPTEKRQKAADFSDGYYQELPEMFLIRAEDVEKFNDATVDFNGKTVGAQAGSTKIEKAEEKCVGATVVSLPLIPDLVNELVNKKIDAILLDGSVAVSYDKSNPDLSVATGLEGVFEIANPIAVAVAKGDPKGLLPGINEAIAKLLEENKVEEFIAIVDQIQGIEEVSAEAPEGYEADE
ncbi:MAG: transporter substrate-binding domain-containing protein [Oscillospiraceae bacterium]|nr:transporter substrate-binding domain-containing protein [Oscillospiraceae bacterium]